MRGRILAALVLLAVVAPLVHADFIVIIANLNARGDSAESDGMGGGGPGAPGGLGGMLGGRGPGMGSSGPGGLGGLGGMMGGGMGPGGRGMMGGGMGPGGFGGTPGGATGSEDGDDDPFIIVAVLEVGELGARLPKFERGESDRLTNGVDFNHRWGKTKLKSKTPMYEVVALKSSGQPVLSAMRRFGKQKEKYGAAPTPENNLELARWALEHGLTGEFVKHMDAVAEAKPDSAALKPALAAYAKVKADLDREPTKSKSEEWRKLLEGYKVAEGKHYDVIHNHATDAADELKPILERMERTMRNYYYWWALQGIALPVPAEKQVAFLTEKPDDFKKLKKHLTASPVLADSFFARREGLAVYAGKRNDESYGTLARTSRPYWDGGYQRNELLKGGLKAGIPKDKWATNALAAQQRRSVPEVDEAHLFALLLKLMEEEWEATSISHEASRQLVYASNLLPRNVHAPEWVMFGMGSFFEVPLQSPFGGVGAASSYWLPRFKESYRAKHYNKDKAAANPIALDALVRVVTDSGFRSRPVMPPPLAGETAQATLHRAEEAQLRRARAASWSLTYFLAKRRPAELQRYFKELSRMPRDVELDDKVLLGCFARAFDCVNVDKSVNEGRLKTLADDWWNFVKDAPIDGEEIHKKIRDYHRQVTRTPPAGGGNTGRGPGGFGPGAAGSGGAGRP